MVPVNRALFPNPPPPCFWGALLTPTPPGSENPTCPVAPDLTCSEDELSLKPGDAAGDCHARVPPVHHKPRFGRSSAAPRAHRVAGLHKALDLLLVQSLGPAPGAEGVRVRVAVQIGRGGRVAREAGPDAHLQGHQGRLAHRHHLQAGDHLRRDARSDGAHGPGRAAPDAGHRNGVRLGHREGGGGGVRGQT